MSTFTRSLGDAALIRILVWRQLIVVVDRDGARASDYALAGEQVNDHVKGHAGGFGLVVVFPPLMTPPEPEIRHAIRDAYARVGTKLHAVAWVIEGTNFRAAAVRAALAGLRLVMRLPFPTAVTNNYEAAVPFVLDKLPGHVSQGVDMRGLITGIRQDVGRLSVQNV